MSITVLLMWLNSLMGGLWPDSLASTVILAEWEYTP